MNKINAKGFAITQMNDEIFHRLSKFIHSEYGIKLPPIKKSMLETRLQKRLHDLELTSFEEYCDYVFRPEGSLEIISMIDAVTTNKTNFFRETAHFDYLIQTVLPALIQRREAGIRGKFLVWSAGCSTGEEPYTLAMVLSEFTETHPGFNFSILATDISSQVLEKAMIGIYKESLVEPVPMKFRKKFLLKSKDKNKNLIRITPKIRELIQFRRLNLMDENYNMNEPFDIIFCRNVIIYFDKNQQEKLLNKMYHNLKPDGFIFMGHSETLCGFNVPLIPVAHTIYRKKRVNEEKDQSTNR